MHPETWPENTPLRVVVVPCAWCGDPVRTTNANAARRSYEVLCEACNREKKRQRHRDYYAKYRDRINEKKRERERARYHALHPPRSS